MQTKNNPALAIDVQVASTTQANLPSATLVKKWCAMTLAQQGIRRAAVCIRIVDGRESAALNKRYRNKRGATNVLSFPADVPAHANDEHVLGDIVICAPLVTREAKQQQKTARAHWAHLVVHGTLHLLGFDHVRKTDAQRMEILEIKILGQFGFDNPYN